MQATIDRKALRSELLLLKKIVPNKSKVPVLGSVLVSAVNGSEQYVDLVVTDLDSTIITTLPASNVEAGTTMASLATLNAVSRTLDSEAVTIRSDDDGCYAEAGSVSVEMDGTFPLDEYPEVPTPDVESLRANSLRRMLNRTAFAVTHDDARYSLNGALFSSDGDTLRVVATDAHRLAIAKQAVDGPEFEGIVPRKLLAAMLRTKDVLSGNVEVGMTDDHVKIVCGPRTFVGRLIEGTFPNWRKVDVERGDEPLRIPREPLLQALKVCGAVKSRSGAVKFESRVYEAADNLKVTASTPEKTISATVPAEHLPDDLTISFNAGYVSQFLKVVDSEHVLVTVQDGDKQARFEPESDDSYRYILMPMRL